MNLTHISDLPTLDEVDQLARARGVALGLRELIVAPGAAKSVLGVAERYAGREPGDLVMLVDNTPYAGPDGPFKEWLAHQLASGTRPLRRVSASIDGSTVQADQQTVDRVAAAVGDASILVTVGSGTLADIGKVVALRLDVAHVVVQTAASVNGFSDDQSVLLVSGAKRTTRSRWPDVLIVDVDVIARAPKSLNRAGVGDLLSIFTAPADWLVASTVGIGPGYDAELVGLVRPHGGRLLDVAGRLDRNDPDDLSFLSEMLSVSGLMMGVALTTAPSSGTEHVISHLLEMEAKAAGRPSSLHGEQVGIATLVASAVWSRVRDAAPKSLPDLRVPEMSIARAQVLDHFGRLGKETALECWNAYEKKLQALHDDPESLQRLQEDWPGLRSTLDDLLASPIDLATAMRAAGATLRFVDLDSGFDAKTVHWAVMHGHRMRDRFLVSDLAELMGLWSDEFVTDVLDELAGLGVGR